MNSTSVFAYHENNDEDEADSHGEEEGDQVVFQRQAEVRHEDHMTPEKQQQRHYGDLIKCLWLTIRYTPIVTYKESLRLERVDMAHHL